MGAKDRIDDLKLRNSASTNTHDWERSRRRVQSGWMSPLEIHEKSDTTGPDLDPSGRRASRKGFLPLSLCEYLALLDWTGRARDKKKRGAIPPGLAPILVRLGIDSNGWCDLVRNFGRLFKRAAGTPNSLAKETARRGQRYMHAPGVELFVA